MAADDTDLNEQEDDYDEEADSDFDGQGSDDVSATESEGESTRKTDGKRSTPAQPRIEELDSGDEATIKERKKAEKKQKHKQDVEQASSDDKQEGQWRAKTRSMRVRDNLEGRKKSSTTNKTVTIDVDRLWEEMNKPAPLPPVSVEGLTDLLSTPKKKEAEMKDDQSKETASPPAVEETITIKRQFKFAGEIHVEEKTVPKSSAEARLWLAQQDSKETSADTSSAARQRPSRKISRFDPNYTNLDAFRNDAIKARTTSFKGSKLNVVEKSKMDWAAHVDAEGLKEELDKHSKAKDAYLNRMDFLGQVEQRKEDEARQARQKGLSRNAFT